MKSKSLIVSALFGAIISSACFIQIPLPGGIPIVLQDMMGMLSGLILGPLYGPLAVLLFLILGSIGLPVFSGKAGFHVLTQGPSGGFITGYLIASFAAGLFLHFFLNSSKEHSKIKSYVLITIAAIIATLIVFILGIAEFKRVTHYDMDKTLSYALIPFIPGNILKIIVMVPLTYKFRPVVKNYLG